MSAFIVDKRHIDYLVKAALELGEGYATYDGERVTRFNATSVGSKLWAENIASVRYRYCNSEWDDMPGPVPTPSAVDYGYQDPGLEIDPIVTLSAIRCYEYQSCEHDEWEASASKRFCEELMYFAISSLPGYDEEPWEITGEYVAQERT